MKDSPTLEQVVAMSDDQLLIANISDWDADALLIVARRAAANPFGVVRHQGERALSILADRARSADGLFELIESKTDYETGGSELHRYRLCVERSFVLMGLEKSHGRRAPTDKEIFRDMAQEGLNRINARRNRNSPSVNVDTQSNLNLTDV